MSHPHLSILAPLPVARPRGAETFGTLAAAVCQFVAQVARLLAPATVTRQETRHA